MTKCYIKSAGLGFSIFTCDGVFLAWYYTEKDCHDFIERHNKRGVLCHG